ncbi:hypothetical protein G6F56_011282 [Rhizopus delemar]|nr:hypothetical protein G6F56_011282 [Rhizopus delemar]
MNLSNAQKLLHSLTSIIEKINWVSWDIHAILAGQQRRLSGDVDPMEQGLYVTHVAYLLRKGALGAQTESCILSGSTGESQSLVGVTKESIFPENYPFVLMNPKYGFNTTIDEVSVTASQKQFKTIDTLKIPTCDDNIKENNTPPLRIYQWKK